MEVRLFNLILAWAWIVMGFLSGMVMGLFFHQEKWLGGYASFKGACTGWGIFHSSGSVW